NNTLSGNIAFKNGQVGIWLSWSDNNTILKNTVNDNGNSGIYLGHSDYNTILGNNAKGNFIGMWIWECHTIDITGNNVNGSYIGIGYEGCENSTNSGNNVNGNDYGMWVTECYNNNFTGNNVNGNDYGIYLDDQCDYNTITENVLYNNTLGIFIDSSSDSNSIYENFFLENGKHAIDDGTDNTWNSTSIGNYWDNWTSPDVSPNDGIVDDPYTYIGGSAGSIDYLPIAEDGAPVIVINSPDPGDVFGATAPSFDVNITDVYLVSMWYTLDGGLHNYTFTENGKIDQSAWSQLPEGSVTITFYAKDILGNEAFESVIVTKSIIEPGMIITIIVVSIVSGVALIGVGYIYFKKRKIAIRKSE
ncbi:MAG: right-handed parallel beta-helix repeat-containing protein, partial [Candidatus Lokiarchaeota archaeon]|nr:right-handed parallel beta-helix repeat-containing protein [Candidatus Lokiarchaeota archaeon]